MDECKPLIDGMTVVAFAADFKLSPDEIVEASPGGGIYNLYGALAVGPGKLLSLSTGHTAKSWCLLMHAEASHCLFAQIVLQHVCQLSFLEFNATRLMC